MNAYSELETRPCICGSGRAIRVCCLRDDGKLFRKPSEISLNPNRVPSQLERCYLRSARGCSEKLSGEHVVSAAVLERIGGKRVLASGLPWIPTGKEKLVGISSLVGNCLCTAHNSRLSLLDSAAGDIYGAVSACVTNHQKPSKHFLFSGHDFERWLLKTLAGMGASKNLATVGERLPGEFPRPVNVPALLESPPQWRAPAGLYFSQNVGDRFATEESFALRPIFHEVSKKLVAMDAMVQNLTFTLVIKRTRTMDGSGLRKPAR